MTAMIGYEFLCSRQLASAAASQRKYCQQQSDWKMEPVESHWAVL